MLRNLDDDLVKRLREDQPVTQDMVSTMQCALQGAAADRIEELEAKLEKKDGCLEETYRRWKNGADLRALAKAEGCTQERMRLKMKRYEEDKVRLLEAKLAKAVEALEYYNVHGYEGKEARATLAELKGNTDAPK